ncbi:MAG TPA: ABC transporter permease [Terriglobales bacterium]|nr:ABC transporter permease [Terriglobales bacterium]
MQNMMQDFRYALRQLRKSPSFTLAAVLTLALGIGANLAVFSVMNAVLLNPSGIPHPDHVVAVRATYAMGDLKNINISPPDFGDAVLGTNTFTSAAVMTNANFNYNPDGVTPVRLIGAKVSWQWFDVFWAKPHLGRIFRAEEDQPNADHEVVLSYTAWKQRFGSDPSIVGRSIQLNQQSYQVIGVMGPDFAWPNQAELWVPLALPSGQYFDRNYRYNEYLFSVARLKSGITLEQANAYLKLQASREIESEGQNSYGRVAGWGMFCMPLVDFVAGNLRKPLLILLAAVATVLLIACANIAGLQLARASARQRAVSVQIALGVSRARLVQQALMESFLLSFAGLAVGIALAFVLIPGLMLFAPTALMQNIQTHVDGQLLLFAGIIATFCALICSVAPAWHATHSRWFQALQEGGRSETSSRSRQLVRSTLVVVEIGLAMLLLSGAGLLLRSMEHLQQVETGFDAKGLMSALLSLPQSAYKTDEQQAAFLTALEQQLKSSPGIANAAIIDALPFTNSGGSASFTIKGRTLAPNDSGPHGNVRRVSPDYFSTMRIPVVRGRAFEATDRANTEKVVVIDETLARAYWPGQDPLGEHISYRDDAPPATIVGIVKHARATSLEADTSEGFYYFPLAQDPGTSVAIAVRASNGNPNSITSALASAVRAIDPSQPIYDIKTMEDRVNDSLIGRRFLVVMLSVFAGLALLLAAVGLYGVISYSVKLRTRELGVRMTLGASRTDVLRLILSNGIKLAAAGLALGLVSTFVFGQALSSLLYGVGLFNPLTLIVTALLLSGAVLMASYLPARRAAKVDPMVALRYE